VIVQTNPSVLVRLLLFPAWRSGSLALLDHLVDHLKDEAGVSKELEAAAGRLVATALQRFVTDEVS
jgi:hypothetical protein